MKLKYIPNMICVLRIILVAPIVWSLLDGRYGLALSLILLAGFSDALDGFLAGGSTGGRVWAAFSTQPRTSS